MFKLEKFRRSVLVGAGLAVLFCMATAASADPLPTGSAFTIARDSTWVVNYTSTQFPGSTASATYSLSEDGKILSIAVTNTSTDPTKIHAFGFDSTPNAPNTPAPTLGGAFQDNWTFTTTSTANGILQVEVLGASDQGNWASALTPGETGTVQFYFSSGAFENGVDFVTIDNNRVHFTSLPDGSSEKAFGTPIGEIPEPFTILLLGSGMVAGAYARRRRAIRQ